MHESFGLLVMEYLNKLLFYAICIIDNLLLQPNVKIQMVHATNCSRKLSSFFFFFFPIPKILLTRRNFWENPKWEIQRPEKVKESYMFFCLLRSLNKIKCFCGWLPATIGRGSAMRLIKFF